MDSKKRKDIKPKKVTLFVACIPKVVRWEMLAAIIMRCGDVYEARIIPQRDKPLSNIGFVEVSPACAESVLHKIIRINDVRLRIQRATGRPSKKSRMITFAKKRDRNKPLTSEAMEHISSKLIST